MSSTNPTVPLNVTARELRVITDLLGYNTGCIALREKLTAAGKDMRLATRQKNRESKIARKVRAFAAASSMTGEKMIEPTWHADDCGGTCDGCGHIASDGFWYNAPCPDSLLAFQLEWAENGVPNAVRAE